MKKELFARYAEIKRTMSALESEVELLKPQIIEEMHLAEKDEAELPGLGKFYFAPFRKWEYSADIQAREQVLKADKKEAEQKGTANYVETQILKFNIEKTT